MSEETPCPGFHRVLRDDISPVSAYPLLLHSKRELPWTTVISGDSITLVSTACTIHSPPPDWRISIFPESLISNRALPCTECQRLHGNNLIMGLRNRALDGAHESTPWQYLSMSQLMAITERKTAEITKLKLGALNSGKQIMQKNRELDTWKRLAMAIGQEDIPRIRALMASEVKHGRSVYSMLEKIDQAAKRLYSAKDYKEVDFHRAFLIYKLGGRSAADIAHKALGIPSITTTKRRIGTVPLQSSARTPTLGEMEKNLDIALEGIAPLIRRFRG